MALLGRWAADSRPHTAAVRVHRKEIVVAERHNPAGEDSLAEEESPAEEDNLVAADTPVVEDNLVVEGILAEADILVGVDNLVVEGNLAAEEGTLVEARHIAGSVPILVRMDLTSCTNVILRDKDRVKLAPEWSAWDQC